ncbi:MAG: MgtC/SapB family protein [Omnitrophica bacterium]|nr:MgtC/SapB family protein [Candidatus Omnitrophota bacterium]
MEYNAVIVRLFLALLCGAVVGLERELHDKAAGLRTHILVCLGACLFGILGQSLTSHHTEADILRVAQGILIGVGFLGAGVIFKEGDTIRGLTTAAGMWVIGAVGLAIGTGNYYLGIVGTLFVFITLSIVGRVERWKKK